MILDRLILTCKDESLQVKVLENNWSLKDFLKYATTKQDVEAQRIEMKMEIKSELPDPQIRRVTEKTFSTRKSQKIYSFRNRINPRKPINNDEERKTCTKCGRDKSHLKCPAEIECFNRHKLGHFSAQCFSRKSDSNRSKQVKASGSCGDPASRDFRQDSAYSSDSNPEFYKCVSKKLGIRAVKGQNSSNILLPVYVCGTKIIVDPDTGADVDLISVSDFKKIHEANPEIKKQIKKPKQKIYALNGEELEVIAIIKDAKLSNKNAKMLTDLYIIGDGIHKYPLLIGKSWYDQIQRRG
jgi:hypothetical protein